MRPRPKPALATAPTADPRNVADRIKAVVENHRSSPGVSVVVGNAAQARQAMATRSDPHDSGSAHTLKPTSTAHTVAAASHGRVSAAIRNGHAAPEAHGAKGHDPHWSYEGEYGPENWARVKPEFNVCAIGKRQSPVHIQETGTLQGPAEPLVFDYRPSGGTVVNNGHTIQVDLEPGNTLSVRGSTYQLLQFHFHHPSEEKVNHKGFSMVAHLVHKNFEGQLAVVAVLIDPGAANDMIHKVWTHMPLDSGDRVRLPPGLIDVRALLPRRPTLLPVHRLADHPALHRRRAVERAQVADDGQPRTAAAVCPAVPQQRTTGAGTQRAGGARSAIKESPRAACGVTPQGATRCGPAKPVPPRSGRDFPSLA